MREPLSGLGSLLGFYPGEEIYYDALRIHDLGHFYRHYIELIPRLSLHGQHFPPGLALAVLLWFATGFNLPQHFVAAHAHNLKLMTRVIGSDPGQHHLLIAYGNAAAFLIGTGVAVGSALLLRLRQGDLAFDPFRIAICCSLVRFLIAGWLQAYLMEIFLFTLW